MQWVKASERLPEVGGEYFVIDNGVKNVGIFADGFFWADDRKLRVSRWLDESPLPASDGVEFAEWLRKNFRYAEGGKWSAAEHFNYYYGSATTTELYTIFTQTKSKDR